MDSTLPAAAPVVWLLWSKSQESGRCWAVLTPKGAIHGIGAMPSGLSGISAHVTVIIGLRISQQKEIRKKFLMVEKLPRKPLKVCVFERLKSG